MSIDYVADTTAMTRRFVREDAYSLGGTQPAMRHLARKLEVALGTITGYYRGNRKTVDVGFFARLKQEEATRLQRAISKAHHEMDLVRKLGLSPDDARYCAAEAAVVAAQKVLEG